MITNSIARNFGALLPLIIVSSLLWGACNPKPVENAEGARIAELARQVSAKKARVADMRGLEDDVADMEERISRFEEDIKNADARDSVTAILAIHPSKTLAIPDYTGETVLAGPLKLGFIEMKIAAPYEDALAIMRGMENSREISLRRVNLKLTGRENDAIATFVLTYAEGIVLEGAAVSTEEIGLPASNPDAQPRGKIAALTDMLEKLTKLEEKHEALLKRKGELKKALTAIEGWNEKPPSAFNFLYDLPLIWPIGIPDIERIDVADNSITIYGDGEIKEVTPFLMEFYEQLKQRAAPFEININPLLGDLIDGREATLNRGDGRVALELEGFPLLDFASNEVLSMAIADRSVYIVNVLHPATGEENVAPPLPAPARSVEAIDIMSKRSVWERPMEGEGKPVTNIILDRQGRLMLGQGNEVYVLSREDGKKLSTVKLNGSVIELVTGSWGGVMAHIRAKDGGFKLTPVELNATP